MDANKILSAVETAIHMAENWAEQGWPMTFGPKSVAVNNLKTAREMSETFSYRLDALAYWQAVDETGKETATHGRKAKTALEKGDLAAAHNAVYFACFVEKKIDASAPTWSPVKAMVESNLAKD